MSDKNLWLVYVALAGLAWGTYVPLIFYGGNELGGKPGSRFLAILCVGVAYFIIGVLFPLAIFFSGQAEWPDRTPPRPGGLPSRRRGAGRAGAAAMTPAEAMERINVVLAHLWMVRNFLKHADEVQDDEGMLDVHRMIFDYIRDVEPSYQRQDAAEYL